jgi:hypothetical protein
VIPTARGGVGVSLRTRSSIRHLGMGFNEHLALMLLTTTPCR